MIEIYDVVAILEDMPEKNLRRGCVGTVIEILAAGVFEVEFSDKRNELTYAIVALNESQLLKLYFELKGFPAEG